MYDYICVSVHHPIYYINTHTPPSIKERVPSLAALLSFATVQRGSGVNKKPAPSSKCLQPYECAGHSACAVGFSCYGAAGPIPHGPCESVVSPSSGTKRSFSDQEVSFQTFLCTADWVVY